MRSNEQKTNVRKMIIIMCMAVITLALLTTCCMAANTNGENNNSNDRGMKTTWTNTNGGDHGGADWTPASGAEIAGNHTNISTFTITAGTIVHIKACEGTWNNPDCGNLSIQAHNIYINGTLNGTGRGYRNEEGPGRGAGPEDTGSGSGGGGGYGGSGGMGGGSKAGGTTYGNPINYSIEKGSGGGNSPGYVPQGGWGGAAIQIKANTLFISGNITSNGANALSHAVNLDLGGGGSGGGILLKTANITATGNILANGGNGGSDYGGYICTGGGGGGGGRIKIFYTIKNITGTVAVGYGLGGTADYPAQNGYNGTIYYQQIDWIPITTTLTPNPAIPNGDNSWYTSNVSVNLTATAEDGINYIEYKEGNGNWITYTGNFTVAIQGNITIYYRAVDKVSNVEDTKSAEFKIDKTAPETRVYSINPDAPYVTGVPFILSWGGIDSTSGVQYYDIEYKVGIGSSWLSLLYHTTATSTSFSALSEGQTVYFRGRAIDNAGNVEDWLASNEGDANVSIDNTPPSTSESHIGTAGLNSWYISSVEVALASSDSVSGVNYTEYRINSGAWTAYTTPFMLTTDGTYTVDYRSADKAGNTESAKSVTIKIDKTPPTTSNSFVGTAGENDWFTSSVEVSLSSTDSTSGPDYIKYSWDNATFSTYNSGSKPGKDADGTYTIYFYGVDYAGLAEPTKSVAFKIDKSAPATSDNSDANWHNSNVVIALTPTDLISGISTTVYGINDVSCPNTGTAVTVSTEGTNTVYYKSKNNAGLWENTKSCTVKIDKTAPATTASLTPSTADGENGWYKSTVTIAFTSSDTLSGTSVIKYRINSGDWITYTTSFSQTADGTYTVEYYAADIAGNSETIKSLNFKLDRTEPSGSIAINSGAGYTNSTAVTLTLSSTDATSGTALMQFSSDATIWTGWENYSTSKAWTLTAGADGQRTVYVQYKDYAGNIYAVTDSIGLDTTPPTTAISFSGTSGSNGWYTTNVGITLSASDSLSGVGTTKYKIDNGTWQDYALPISFTAEGTFSLCYHSTDNIANAEAEKIENIKIDKTMPGGTVIINSGATYTTSRNVILTLTASDATSQIWQMCFSNDGTSFTDWESYSFSKNYTLPTGDGIKTVHFKVRDYAGNEYVATDSITLDMTPPAITITYPQNNTYVSSASITIAGTIDDAAITTATLTFNSAAESITVSSGSFSKQKTLSSGANTIQITATDAAGNTGSSALIVVTLDTAKPSLTVTSPSDNFILSSTSIVVAGTTNPTGITLTVNGIAASVNSDGTFSYTYIASADGQITVVVKATNQAGTSTFVNKTGTVDTAAPSRPIELTVSPLSWTNYNQFTLDWTNPTDTSGIKGLYYKIGTQPTGNTDGTYTTAKPLVISVPADGSYTVYVWLVDNANNINYNSRESIVIYYDGTAPKAPNLTYPQSSDAISDTTPTFAWENTAEACSGLKNYEITVDNNFDFTSPEYATTTTINEATASSLADGLYYWKARAVDNANNIGSWSTVWSFRIDSSLPGITSFVISSGALYTNTTTVSLTINAENASQMCFSNDGTSYTAWEAYATSKAWTLTAEDGMKTVYAKVRNLANVSSGAVYDTITLDMSAPAAGESHTGTLGTNGWYVSSVAVTLTASDATSGVSQILFRYKTGGTWTAWNIYSSTFTLTLDAEYELEYYSVDNAANAEVAKSTAIKIDKTKPETAAAKTPAQPDGSNNWYKSDVMVNLTAGDSTSGVSIIKYRLSGGAWLVYTSEIVLNTDGTHTIEYNATDLAGNVEVTKSLTVQIDKTAPASAEQHNGTAGSGGWYLSDVIVYLTSSDTTSGTDVIKYQPDAGQWQAYTGPITISTDGTHTFSYYSADKAGNSEPEKSVEIKIDQMKPSSNAVLDPPTPDGMNTYYRSTVAVTLTASDATAGVKEVQYKLNNGTWQLYSEQISVSADGSYTVYYYSVDSAGNTESTKNITFKIDMTPPTTALNMTGIGTNGWYGVNTTITLSTDEPAVIYFRWDNYIYQYYISSLSAVEGTHTIYYYAVDQAGNAETEKSREIKVDTSLPVCSVLINGGAIYTNNTFITLALSCTDATTAISKVRFSNDGIFDTESWQLPAQTVQWTLSSGDGNKTVYFEVCDEAGNTAVSAASVILDATAPVTTVNTAGNFTGAIYASEVLVTVSVSDISTCCILYRIGNSSEWLNYTDAILLTESGYYELYIRAVDGAGNVQLYYKALAVNKTIFSPTITVDYIYYDQANETIIIEWTASDPQGKELNITISIGGTNVTVLNTGKAELPSANFTNSNFTVSIAAINQEGRTAVCELPGLTINNRFVREINVSQTEVQGRTIPIYATITNYAPEPKLLTVVFYDGDANIGSKQVYLHSLETQIVSINYTLEHASEHTITIKVFDENNNKIDSASVTMNVSLSELQIQPAMNPAWMIALGVAFFVGMAIVSLLIKRRRQKYLNEGEGGEE